MKYYFLFAWRNLWRNRRRTLLATSSIFFAMLIALIYRSLQSGQHDYMVQMSVSMYTGHLQIQGKGYWDERSFDYSFEPTDTLWTLLAQTHHITTINPRIESVALISHQTETRISPVIGIKPETEDAMSGLKKRLVRGNYLTDSSRGVLIAEGLAERLHVGVGDSVVVFGQGYEGATVAVQLPVEGILRFPIPKLNDALLFLALSNAQEVFNAYNRVTSIVLMVDQAKNVERIQSALTARIGEQPAETGIPLIVMDWKEMSPEIVQAIEADVAGEVIIMFILYVVIGFGVFGTVMMMTIERTREFGLLLSLGMKRGRLILLTTVEALLVSVIGAASGIAAALPLLSYFYTHPIHLTGDMARVYLAYGFEPILPVSVEPAVFTTQTVVVLVLAMIASLYPMFFLRRIQPVPALQGRGGAR